MWLGLIFVLWYISAIEFIETNNNGACCVSDSVYHKCCIYTNAGQPIFQIQNCGALCSNDENCKGYSTVTVTVKSSSLQTSVDFCLLYTTSSCTNRDINENPVECHGMFSFSTNALKKDASCPYPSPTGGNIFSDGTSTPNVQVQPLAGCLIKSSQTQGIFHVYSFR